MTRELFDPVVWKAKCDELAGALRADPVQGLSRWLDALAESVVAGDAAACDVLVNSSFPLPKDVSAVVERDLRPGILAWRGGRTTEAAKLLSTGVPRAEPIIAKAIPEPAEEEDEDGREAALYALKGAWLEAAGRRGEAAGATFEAGKRFSWQGEAGQEIAIELLTRAMELDAGLVAAYWHLAEALRVRSFTPQPPYAAREPLERSLAVWNAGAARALPDASTSWPYVTRALICEQQARLNHDSRIALWWQAVVYLERAILLDEADPGRWAALGRLHRLLENAACALHVTAEAVKRDPKDASALEERAAILANTGRFDEAAPLIEQRLAQDSDNTWARGVKAYVLANRTEYQAALDLIDQVIALEPDNIWNLDLRSLCCRMVGDRARARATDEQIWAIQTAAANLASEDRCACASAAYRLGKVDEAIALLEKLSGDVSAGGDVLRALGLCYFAKGNVVRAEELLLSGLARAQIHELNLFRATDLTELESQSADWRHAPGAIAVFNRVKKTTAALVAGLSPSVAEDIRTLAAGELTTLLQVLPDDDVSAMKLGAEAGLARLKLDQQRWNEAAEAYRQLQRPGLKMPEAAAGIERSIEGLRADARGKAAASDVAAATASFTQLLELQAALSKRDQLSIVHEELGDTLWRAGDAAALEHFQHALALAPKGEDDARLGRLHARVALAFQQQGETAAARTNFLEALRRQREAKSPEPGEALSSACRQLIRNVEHFWSVDASWGKLGTDSAVPDFQRRDFDVARASALTYLNDLFGLSKHADASLAVPFVTPVALEVGSELVPLVDPKSDGGKFIFEDIPAVRNSIESSTGVRMPGLKVRGDASSSDRYAILLDEVPAAAGAVRVGRKFTLTAPTDLAAAGVPDDDMIECTDPVSGDSGRWCSSVQTEPLEKRRISLLTETQFVLAHVDLVLRQHLDMFLGVQELQDRLRASEKKGLATPELTSALADATFCLFFARVLRALVREQVPIAEWTLAFEVARQLKSRSVDEAVAQIRLTMRDQLPGNRKNIEHVELPADLVYFVRSDQRVMKASPSDAHRLLVDIRRLLEGHTGPIALVVPAGPRPRLLVRRLIEFEFPTVAVLSGDEVLPREQPLFVPGSAPLESTSL